MDLSRVLAGPYATQMLADHGADVVKVEPPAGDETRRWGPPFLDSGTSAYYSGINRNKSAISLDLTTEEGQSALAQLLQRADVLVENFKAGTLDRWGFSDERLDAEFPRLVHARITGFGTDGPMGGAPGYDAVLQAYSGLMSVNGEADGPPLRVGVPVVDLVTGMYAMSGILMALLERVSSGRGQLVDVALLDTAITLLHPHSGSWLADGQLPVRTGSAHPTVAPYDVFATREGPIFLAVGNDRMFRELVAVLERPELAEDPRFLTNSERVAHVHELRELLAEAIDPWDRRALSEVLLERGVPSSPVQNVAQALTDPQVLHRRMVVEADAYRGIGIPVKLSRTPGAVRHGPQPQGADTASVLRGLAHEVASPSGRPDE